MYSGRIKKTALARRVAKTCQSQLRRGERPVLRPIIQKSQKKKIDVRKRYDTDGGVGLGNGGYGIH